MEKDKRPSPRPSQLLTVGSVIPYQPVLFAGTEPPLRFVIKRHQATTLHTDYRFEVFGKLFSLVSSDHPSFDPRRPIRLREVPDHDPAYMESERRIPDGFYGAGAVLVWDFGTFCSTVPFGVSPSEAVFEALLAGRLDFRFEGRRMKGLFRLEIQSKDWRLLKLEDEYATASPLDWDDCSIVTGRSLDDIEREYRK